jgi:hypothetical protein
MPLLFDMLKAKPPLYLPQLPLYLLPPLYLLLLLQLDR